jgi:protein gp37
VFVHESRPFAVAVDTAGAVAGSRDQCLAMGVAFFFKQWGGVNKKAAGRELEGRTWDQMPEAAVPRARRSVAMEVVYAWGRTRTTRFLSRW